MKFDVSKITVIIREHGTDVIYVYTKDFPDPFPNLGHENPMFCFQFNAPKGRGVKYVHENFKFDPNVVDEKGNRYYGSGPFNTKL